VKRPLFVAASVIALLVAGMLGATKDTPEDQATAILTREEVERAFIRAGFALQSRELPMLEAEGDVLGPVNFKPFTVFVLRTEALANEHFEPYRTHTLDAFNLLRRNVFVVSDSGLAKHERDRIRASLELLVAENT
jgi:hypothetical protein